jgi:hypothetical protein
MAMTKIEKKIYWIFMAISMTIGVTFLVKFSINSKNARSLWIEYEIPEKTINNYIHIDKNIFVQLDTVWFSLSYNRLYESSDLIGCTFNKHRSTPFYYINCSDTSFHLFSRGGRVVTDKIWLRRINMALDKENRRKEKLKH